MEIFRVCQEIFSKTIHAFSRSRFHWFRECSGNEPTGRREINVLLPYCNFHRLRDKEVVCHFQFREVINLRKINDYFAISRINRTDQIRFLMVPFISSCQEHFQENYPNHFAVILVIKILANRN